MTIPARMRQFGLAASGGITLRRKLPTDFGAARIYVTPESMLRFWRPSLQKVDPPLFAAVQNIVRPEDVVWDVGANVGLFSFAAAWICGSSGSVFAFEPDAWLASMIQRSARQLPTGYAPVDVLSVAISEYADVRRLSIGKEGRATNHLDEALGQASTTASTLVSTLTLDWLAERLPAPNVLKIDVEGAEVGVLKGATQLLCEYHPVVLCEVAEENSEVASSILHGCGYTLFDQDGLSAVQQAPFNTLAIPGRCTAADGRVRCRP